MSIAEWVSPGAMGEHGCYLKGHYLEIWNVNPDRKIVGYRWEVRQENKWLDAEPLSYGLTLTLEAAKTEAERAVGA